MTPIVVLHYAETGPMAAPPRAEAYHDPAAAWVAAGKLKRRRPGDRVTVLRGAETEVEG